MISVVACCHGAKLCAYSARAFDVKSATRKLREERKDRDCDSILSGVTVLDESCIAYLD